MMSQPGNQFGIVPLVSTVTLVFSIITFGLAISYINDVAKAPLDPYAEKWYHVKHPSTTTMIFYSVTMPFLTILHALTDLVLTYLSMFTPLYVLIASAIFVCGWLTQWSFWANCEASSLGLEYGKCPQERLQYPNRQHEGATYEGPPPIGIDGAKSNARMAFGFFVIVSYLVIMTWAAVKVHRKRMERKRGGATMPTKEVTSESSKTSP